MSRMRRSLPVLLLLLLAAALCALTPAAVHASTDVARVASAATTVVSRPSAASGKPRFAYVLMHYEGTPKDDEYVLGLRVLIRSIKNTGTPHDILVILSSNVRQSTRDLLTQDGAILREVTNIENPFEKKVAGRNSYKARFVFSFNKLYLWDLEEYTRVIFLDSDNIFLDNMDTLFHCGHFCVVFMNPLIFHTGLIVVKPDKEMFNKLVHTLYSDASFSHDGADQGFLVAQFDVEHAPLYLPSEFPTAPSEAPAMRLNIGWNINHFWYYITFSWSWFFSAPGLAQEYPWMRAYHAAGERSDAVAGSSLAYPSGMMLKPWYWFPTFYFSHHYKWHAVRAQLDIDYWPTLLSRYALLAALYPLFRLLNSRSRIDRVTSLEPVRDVCARIFGLAPVLLGYLYGVFAFFLSGYLAFQLVPYTTSPAVAWAVFCGAHLAFTAAHLCLLVNFALRPTSASIKKHSALQEAKGNAPIHSAAEDIEAAAAAVTGWKAMLLLLVGQAVFFAAWLDIYPHFIVKIACFEYLLMLWIGLQAHAFRRAAQRMNELLVSNKQ